VAYQPTTSNKWLAWKCTTKPNFSCSWQVSFFFLFLSLISCARKLGYGLCLKVLQERTKFKELSLPSLSHSYSQFRNFF
jgi:hypothetical protein